MLRHRRPLLLLPRRAGCAGPVANPPPPPPLPVPPPFVEAPAPAPAPSPITPVRPPTTSGDIIFDAWAAEFYGRAIKAGISPALLDREMAGLTPDPRVASRDSRQPEFSQPISVYI